MKSSNIYFCIYGGCGKAFSKPSRLQQHARTHTGERPYKCTEPGCSHAYARAAHLTRHVKNSHSESAKSRCRTEGSASPSKQAKVYACKFENCGRTFKKKNSLYYHKLTHEDKKNFVCQHEGCGKAFVFPSKLRRHERTHKGYKCTAAAAATETAAVAGEQQQQAAVCGASFITWSALAAHRRTAHKTAAGRRRFACNECERTFARKYHLSEHVATHAAARTVFVCTRDGCQRKFFYLRNFVVHLRTAHDFAEAPGKRPARCPCPSCDKAFPTLSGLRRHLDVHKRQAGKAVGKKYPKKGHRKISELARLIGLPEPPVSASDCGAVACDADRTRPADVSADRKRSLASHSDCSSDCDKAVPPLPLLDSEEQCARGWRQQARPLTSSIDLAAECIVSSCPIGGP